MQLPEPRNRESAPVRLGSERSRYRGGSGPTGGGRAKRRGHSGRIRRRRAGGTYVVLVAAVGRRGETEDQQPGRRTQERDAPVVLITERGALLAGHALAPLDQASIGRSCVRFKRLGDVDQTCSNDCYVRRRRWGLPRLTGERLSIG
jgi:hypothetical protein